MDDRQEDRNQQTHSLHRVGAEDIERLRAVYRSLRGVRFAPTPWVSLKDLLALLAVVARLKSVAAFGFLDDDNEGSIRQLREALINFGLTTILTPEIWRPSSSYLEGFPSEIVAALEQEYEGRYPRNRKSLLWVTCDATKSSAIKNVVRNAAQVGHMLGYPVCCVEQDVAELKRDNRAIATAVMDAVGTDPEPQAILNVLRNPLPVESSLNDNLIRTDERFPFVFHAACNECLTSEESQTAALNAAYEKLAHEIDNALVTAMRRMAPLEAAIQRIGYESELHGLTYETLSAGTKQKLAALNANCRELYLSLTSIGRE